MKPSSGCSMLKYDITTNKIHDKCLNPPQEKQVALVLSYKIHSTWMWQKAVISSMVIIEKMITFDFTVQLAIDWPARFSELPT